MFLEGMCQAIENEMLFPFVLLTVFSFTERVHKYITAEVQPRLIQGIRRRDGLGDYLYVN